MSALAGRHFRWVIECPQRTFFAAFAALMLLGPGLATFISPLPLEAWTSFGAAFSVLAALPAGAVYVRKRAPRLSWSSSFGLVVQFAAGILALLAPNVVSVQSSFAPPFRLVLALWGVGAMACAWALSEDRWYGYFAEILVLCSFVSITVLMPTPARHSAAHVVAERFPGERATTSITHALTSLAEWVVFVRFNLKLFQKGMKGLRLRRAAGPPNLASKTTSQ